MAGNEWEAQILSLRALTATTGAIHEAQLLQLRMWGGIAFKGLGKWSASPDVSTKTVTYTLDEKKKLPKGFPKLVAALDRSIHWLLGEDWALTISQSGKLLYEGSREVTNVADERNARAGNREG